MRQYHRRYNRRRAPSGRRGIIVLAAALFAVSFLGFTILKHNPQPMNGDANWPLENTSDAITPLNPGDSGAAVEKMQKRLADLGYYVDGEDAGIYGEVTKASLQYFQRENGLAVDGIAQSATLAKLYSEQAKEYTINQGDTGSDVAELQRRLTELNYFTGSANGQFGTSTADAVKAFQQKNDLIADGKVGQKTYGMIYSSKAKAAVVSGSSSKPASVQTTKTVNSVLQLAQKQLGKKYILGDEGPNTFDCSGFVYYCFKHVGVNIGRQTALGYSNVDKWKDIEKSKLQPGDILFFGIMGNGIVGHIGIYMGNNKMIESSSTYGGVVIVDLSETYYAANYISAKRVI